MEIPAVKRTTFRRSSWKLSKIYEVGVLTNSEDREEKIATSNRRDVENLALRGSGLTE